MPTKIQIRRDSAANWSSANPILSDGEMGYERDTKQFKVGNGADAWNALDYTSAETVSTLLDLGITDGSAGQALTTDGNGNFAFADVASDTFLDGGLSNSSYSVDDLVIDAGDSN